MGAFNPFHLYPLLFLLLLPALAACLRFVPLHLLLLNVVLELGHATISHNFTPLHILLLRYNFNISRNKERIKLGDIFVFAEDVLVIVI